jgi:hypothetical protein
VAGAILLSRTTLWFDGDAWWLFLIAGAVILWVSRKPRPASEPATGTTETTETTEVVPRETHRVRGFFRWLGIVVASLIALLVIAVGVFVAVFDVHPGRGIGDQSYIVTSRDGLRDEYRLGIGSLDVDLSRMQFPLGVTYLDARVDVGDLHVVIPPGVAVRGYAEARAGHVNVLGAEDDNWNADVDLSGTGPRVLDLTAHVGAGSIRVERAVR